MIKSVKNNKTKNLTIKLKAMKADGYEVATATSSKKLKKAKKGKNFTKAKIVLKKMKKGKTYFIKVRAYNKDANGKKVYGKWSKVKRIKVRK